MKKYRSIILFILLLCLLLSVSGFASCGDRKPDEETKMVESIEIGALPNKTEYLTGESISLDGGKLTVKYTDESAEVLELTAEGVEVNVSDINMDTEGAKTLTVRFGGKRTTFKINVAVVGLSVTFDLNYDGADVVLEKVDKGECVEKPADPVRAGTDYAFHGWYTDETMTYEFNFESKITESITVYALWIAGDVCELTLDYNYYGVNSLVMKIQEGSAPRVPAPPIRDKFEFLDWYADAKCTTEFDFTAAMNVGTTVYAGWKRTAAGAETYTFEAEHTDLTYLKGPGVSGDASGKNTIVSDGNASNYQYVGYLYRQGNSIEYYIGCSEAVTDVTLTVRMSADIPEVTFIDSDLYGVRVNGEYLPFGRVGLACADDGTSAGEWIDVVIGRGLSFEQGLNTIELITINSRRPSDGATYEAMAPVIDCIKLTTSAVLIWDGTRNLPWIPG